MSKREQQAAYHLLPYLRPLTTYDYVHMDVKELVKYQDFSQHALRVVGRLMDATSKELEELDLSHIKGAKNHDQRS